MNCKNKIPHYETHEEWAKTHECNLCLTKEIDNIVPKCEACKESFHSAKMGTIPVTSLPDSTDPNYIKKVEALKLKYGYFTIGVDKAYELKGVKSGTVEMKKFTPRYYKKEPS